MQFTATDIEGCWIVGGEPRSDERGAFARAYCRQELAAVGVDMPVAQANLATTNRAGTVRGLHYQLPPSAEIKLIRAVRGALFDVVVDLRRNSPTFGRWTGAELSADGGLAMLVPEGCAHGYQALTDETDAYYLTSAPYDGPSERGLHHADPAVGIQWPLTVTLVSEKDRGLPQLSAVDLP
jgi:dTDP-4-dehydrorhamnose 3,5-epimerase